MSSLRRLGTKKLRAWGIIAAATLTAVTVAFLMLSNRSAPMSATRLSHQAADKQVPSDLREAEQTPAVLTPMELEPMELEPLARAQSANDPPANETAGAIPVEPARLEPSPAPNPSPPGSEQRMYKSRKALETMDPRDFARHGR